MALPINIKELLNGGTVEWERIEFKEGFNDEALCHSICAFANDLNNLGGGHIIIGIEENSGKPILPPKGLNGNQLDPYQKELIRICHLIDPVYIPQVAPYVYDGKDILAVWVPGGDNRPYKAPISMVKGSSKSYYVRRLSTTARANHNEEKQLLELAARIPFDDRISHFGEITDIELPLIQEFLRNIGSDLLKESESLSHPELCRKMEIARGPDENLRPLNIGLMLFSNQPHKYFKGALIDVVIYSDNTGTKFIEKNFNGPIQHQVKDALAYIKTNVIQEQVLKVFNQEQANRIVNFPFDAIEEALVNAVYHRSYEDDRPTEVNVFKDRIEIISYPGPLPPVDQEALLQERVIARDYRNRRIGDYLKELRLSEGRGTGIPTIRTKMREAGCPVPEFIPGKDNSHFLTILKINSEWDQSITLTTTTTIKNVVYLTNIEQLILEACTDSTLTKEELMELFRGKVSKGDLQQAIESLMKQEYLNEKNMKRIFGVFNFRIYSTTKKGKDILKEVF